MATPGRAMHDHDCDGSDCGAMYSLYKHIDLDRVSCLNEESQGSCKRVFKSWGERTNFTEDPLRSCEGDEELLLHIPFHGEVKLRAFAIIGGSNITSPAMARLCAAFLISCNSIRFRYTNRDDLDCGSVQDLQPVQEFSLNHDPSGILEYTVNASRFNGVHMLDIHIPQSLGAGQTEVHFIGLKGEFYERNRQAVRAIYELKPMADSSKVPGANDLGSFVS